MAITSAKKEERKLRRSTVGALLTGILAEKAWGAPADGLLFGNGPGKAGSLRPSPASAPAHRAPRSAGRCEEPPAAPDPAGSPVGFFLDDQPLLVEGLVGFLL